MILIKYFYCLLWHTIYIHTFFYEYLEALLKVQEFTCTEEDLDRFYVTTQMEEYCTGQDAIDDGNFIDD